MSRSVGKFSWICLSAAVVFLVCYSFAPGQDADSGKPTKAKRLTTTAEIQEALQKKITIDYVSQSWHEVLNHLEQKTGVRFVQDMHTFHFINQNPNRLHHLQFKDMPLGAGLQKHISQTNQTLVILGDRVFITSAQTALAAQMRQLADVDVKETPLDATVQKLASDHAINLVIDPRIAKEAKKPVSLRLNNVRVEDGIRLLAFVGGLKTVRVGKVIVVTRSDFAKDLPPETPLPQNQAFPLHDPSQDAVGIEVVPGIPPIGPDGQIFPGAPGPPMIDPAVPPNPGAAPAPDMPVEAPAQPPLAPDHMR